MTVKELKEKLEKFDENFRIVVEIYDDKSKTEFSELAHAVKEFEGSKVVIIYA